MVPPFLLATAGYSALLALEAGVLLIAIRFAIPLDDILREGWIPDILWVVQPLVTIKD